MGGLKFVETFLEKLTTEMPPCMECHHCLTYRNGRLVLSLSLGNAVQGIRFESDDFEKDPEELVKSIKNALSEGRRKQS